jgi:CRP-like cAMP-binding protein
MDLDAEAALLGRVPMLHDLPQPRLKLLAFASDRVRFAQGEILFRKGDNSDAAYLVINGRAEVVVDRADVPLVVAQILPGAIVGEMGVLCDSVRSATVRAGTDLLTLRLPSDLFIDMLSEFPGMALAVMRDLARRLERTTAQLAER